MKAVVERLLGALDHTLAFGPGHDFQTVQSLKNRGDVASVVHGEAPKEWVVATLTSQGLTRASREIRPLEVPGTKPPQAPWPFAFSSRGWHEPGGMERHDGAARSAQEPRKGKGRG